jgi:hypothetical protein
LLAPGEVSRVGDDIEGIIVLDILAFPLDIHGRRGR